jgi:hypothetical protein
VFAHRRKNEKRRSDAEAVARKRERVNEMNRKQKINAGYVRLNLSKPHQQQRTFSFHISVYPQLPRAHTHVESLESACIRRQPAWIQ